MLQRIDKSRNAFSRRSLLRSGLAAPGIIAGGVLAGPLSAAAAREGVTFGDINILRFLAALEIIEADLWGQYNEIYGIQDNEVPGGSGNATFKTALNNLDPDMFQYVHDNTEDEISHFMFLNAYIESKGGRPVDLGPFHNLAGSSAPGSSGKKRITTLMQLKVDTSWWRRYRSQTGNPDRGDTFAPIIPGLLAGQLFPAIPRNGGDLSQGGDHVQAIANTAAFHFGTIEQGGSSLYPQLAQRVTSPEVLRILLSIGPTETMHFQTWSDKAGNMIPVTDPTNGLQFPDPNTFNGDEDRQANLIMPEPTVFLTGFPVVSIIRPTATEQAATRAFAGLRDSGLFNGQSDAFFATMNDLAAKADRARRGEEGERA